MKIILTNNGGKKWNLFEGSYVKGYAFIGDRLLNEEEIYKELIASIDTNNFSSKSLELNGNFSAIVKRGDKIYMLADKLKTYPLIYLKVNEEWLISDQAKTILDAMTESKTNKLNIASYLATGYLYNNKTFFSDCYIVSAGTYVVLSGAEVKTYQYHQHIYNKKNLSDHEIMEGCVLSMENTLRRMVRSIGDRPIWIPLSGGYDSRLLACVCKKLKIPNIRCFTYGIPGSTEISISEKVAKQLGFPWYCVEYSKEKFIAVTNSPLDQEYMLWGMNLNTTSHFQDFIAIKELKEKGLIESDAVIVPGHSGEILGRDQVPYDLLDREVSVAELIFHRYFQWNIVKHGYKEEILKELGEELNSTIANKNIGLAVDLFTNWNIQNRQANFIVNAVRVYEFFDFEWRIPLWDDELSLFWYSLDYIKNSNVLLYNHFLFQKYFEPMNVAIYKQSSSSRKLLAKIRLPFGIKDIVKENLTRFDYFKIRYDENGLNTKTLYYLERLSHPISDAVRLKKSNANAVLSAYQINFVLNYLDKKGLNNSIHF